jgi:hypothetical protein
MMLWSTLSIAKEPDGYGYPELDPVTATVLGTPEYLQFATEVSIRDEERELIVFPDRAVPPLFQYSRSLHYSLVRQSGRAPDSSAPSPRRIRRIGNGASLAAGERT